MPDKRKAPSSGPGDSQSAKRSRPSNISENEALSEPSSPKPPHAPQQRSDPIFGQKHAFPGLEDEVAGGELFYGPPEDGIEYLRMVRSEARTLPSLVIAKDRLQRNQGISDDSVSVNPDKGGAISEIQAVEAKWTYSDGVVASIAQTSTAAAKIPDADDPQEIYYNLLHHRFRLLRSTLRCIPPASLISALDSNHPISHPANSSRARSEWRELLQRVDPQMVQLACMDTDSVYLVLRTVARLLSSATTSKDVAYVKRIGAWVWGLLGRCKDSGEMSSEEVGEIRDLGKRAIKILVKIREEENRDELFKRAEGGEASEDEDEWAEFSDEREGDGADDLELAKERLQQKLANQLSQDQTEQPDDGEVIEEDGHRPDIKRESRALLDMIISLVGEFYGQRDLLESRDIWEEGEEDWMSA